ncbi:hypothetical protein R6Q59_013510, partial [Mikania micrantha]
AETVLFVGIPCFKPRIKGVIIKNVKTLFLSLLFNGFHISNYLERAKVTRVLRRSIRLKVMRCDVIVLLKTSEVATN